MDLLTRHKPNHAAVLSFALAAVFSVALAAPTVRGAAPGVGLHAVDPTALEAVASLPLPPPLHVSGGARSASVVVPGGDGRTVVDDFEGATWPDPGRWVFVGDLVNPPSLAVTWAASTCRSAGGSRSLWAIGGGPGGAGQACATDYQAPLQTSALLALDLSAVRSARALDLVFDAWADAAPYEGLYVNLVEFDDVGTAISRRNVLSATGRSTDWSTVRLDLLDLRDPRDPVWRGDLRGQFAYIELLMVAVDGADAGAGVFVDDLVIEVTAPLPIIVTPIPSVTPSPSATATGAATQATSTATSGPTPTDRTEACGDEPDCRTLEVRSFIDYNCDGTFRNGVDGTVRSNPRVDIVAGAELLGTSLDSAGRATFRLPTAAGAEVRMELPSGYQMCHNSPNPLDMAPDDFRATGLTRVYMRLIPLGMTSTYGVGAREQGADALSPWQIDDLPAVEIIDDFEDPSRPPTGEWIIDDELGPPEYTWGRRDCHAAGGEYGLWALGAGTRGRQLECFESYPADVTSLIRLKLDLSAYADAQTLNLAFELWANTLSDSPLGDFISINLIRRNAEGFEELMPVYDWTGYTGDKFQTERLNLLDLANVFNPAERVSVAGEPEVVFEFRFRADPGSSSRPEGPTIDDVRLEHDLGPTVTPTPQTTPTHTRTPAPTPPTHTPTPPDVTSAYVPFAENGA